MAILERTPPPGKRTRTAPADSNDHGGGSSSKYATWSHDRARNGESTGCDYVFPSLDALAQPIRELNAARSVHVMRSPASQSPSPKRSTVRRARGSPVSASKRLELPSSPRRHRETSVIEMRKNEPESYLRPSPEGGMNRNAVASPSRTTTRHDMSMEKNTASSHRTSPRPFQEPMVDKAFQEQIERALASGENPFMDRKRAQMRDETFVDARSDLMEHDVAPVSVPDDPESSSHAAQASGSRLAERANHNQHSQVYLLDTSGGIGKSQNQANSHEISIRLNGGGRAPPGPIQSERYAAITGAHNDVAQHASASTRAWRRSSTKVDDSTLSKSYAINESQMSRSEHEREMQSLSAQINGLQASLNDAQSREKQVQSKLEEKRRKLAQRDEEIIRSKERIAEEKDRVRQLRNALAEQENNQSSETLPLRQKLYLTSIRAVKNAMRLDQELRQAAIGRVVARNEATHAGWRLQEATEGAEAAHSQDRARSEALQEAIDSLQEQHDRLSELHEESKDAARDAHAECERMQKELKQVQRKADRCDALSRERDNFKEEVSALQEELARARKVAVSLQKRQAVARTASPPRSTGKAPAPASNRSQFRKTKSKNASSSQRAPQSSPEPVQSHDAIEDDHFEDEQEPTNQIGEFDEASVDTESTQVIEKRPTKQAAKDNVSLQYKTNNDAKKLPASVTAAKEKSKTLEIPKGKTVTGRRALTVGRSAAATGSKSSAKEADRAASATIPAKQSKRMPAQQRDDGDEDESAEVSRVSVTKTPLLPSKRSRAINRSRDEEGNDDVGEDSMLQSKTPVVPRRAVRPAPAGASAKPPQEKPVETSHAAQPMPQQKKKRRLLNNGGPRNVAGDFLDWKGDAEGALDPKLNLPFELSPVKTQAKSRGGTAGAGASKATAASIFGRR